MRLRAPGFRIGAAYGVTFSQSGLFLGQVGRQVVAYDVVERKAVTRSQWHYPHPSAAVFGTTDRWMAVRSTTGAMVVIDLTSSQLLSRVRVPGDTADDSSLFSCDDQHVDEACSSGTLRIRRVSDLRVEYLEQHPSVMLGPASVSRAGETWAIAFNGKHLDQPHPPPCRIEIRRWPLSGAHRQVLGDQFGHIAGLALTPTADRIAILERQPRKGLPSEFVISLMSVSRRSVEERATHPLWRSHRGFAWDPSGRFLVVGTDLGHALLDGNSLAPIGYLSGQYPSDAAFSPDGRLLALGYWGYGLVLPTVDLESWFTDHIAAPDERVI